MYKRKHSYRYKKIYTPLLNLAIMEKLFCREMGLRQGEKFSALFVDDLDSYKGLDVAELNDIEFMSD